MEKTTSDSWNRLKNSNVQRTTIIAFLEKFKEPYLAYM
jgi:hypothetical protein